APFRDHAQRASDQVLQPARGVDEVRGRAGRGQGHGVDGEVAGGEVRGQAAALELDDVEVELGRQHQPEDAALRVQRDYGAAVALAQAPAQLLGSGGHGDV